MILIIKMKEGYSNQAEKKILHAAMELFGELGFYGTKTQMVADKAVVNKALLHYYFKNKECLFEAVLSFLYREWIKEVNNALSTKQTIDEAIVAFFKMQLIFNEKYPSFKILFSIEKQKQPDVFKRLKLKINDFSIMQKWEFIVSQSQHKSINSQYLWEFITSLSLLEIINNIDLEITSTNNNITNFNELSNSIQIIANALNHNNKHFIKI